MSATLVAINHRHRILVVDDDSDIRDLLLLVLQGEGYDVLAAQDGQQALQLLVDPDHVGLILLDMRMPGMDGWAFVAAIKKNNLPARPIIVISAAADVQSWAEEIGAAGHLAKPFSLRAVRAAVRSYLGSPPKESP